jgi:N-methylhydantoinase A
VIRRSFDGRLFGQSWETPFVEVPDGPIDESTVAELVERFHAEYERRFGNRFPMLPVQGVTYRVQLVLPADKVEYARLDGNGVGPAPARTRELRFVGDEPLVATEVERAALAAGARVEGPAIVREPLSTTFVGPGQVATVGAIGELVIERA